MKKIIERRGLGPLGHRAGGGAASTEPGAHDAETGPRGGAEGRCRPWSPNNDRQISAVTGCLYSRIHAFPQLMRAGTRRTCKRTNGSGRGDGGAVPADVPVMHAVLRPGGSLLGTSSWEERRRDTVSSVAARLLEVRRRCCATARSTGHEHTLQRHEHRSAATQHSHSARPTGAVKGAKP